MMACSIGVQAANLWALRRSIQWGGSALLIAGGALGIPIAVYLLQNTDTYILRVGFGLIVSLYAGYMLFRPALARAGGTSNRHLIALIGFGGGLIGGLTAMPGAIPTIWCDMRGMPSRPARSGAAVRLRHHAIVCAGALARTSQPVVKGRGRPRHRRHPAGAVCGNGARHSCIPEHQRGRVPADHSRGIVVFRAPRSHFALSAADSAESLRAPFDLDYHWVQPNHHGNKQRYPWKIMTAHQRNFSTPIDPVKLDRLAEVAVKVGLQLQAGQDLFLTAPTVARLPLVRKIAEHAYKAGAGPGDADLLPGMTRGHHRWRVTSSAMIPVSTAPRAGSMRGCRRRSTATPRGWRHRRRRSCMLLSGQDPAKVARASKGQFDRLQAGAGKVSSPSISTGTSSPIRARHWAKQVFPG